MVTFSAQGHITITRQRNGKNGTDGKSSVVLVLTNDNDEIMTDEDGNVTGAYPTTQGLLYDGGVPVAASAVVWSVVGTNCTATIDANGNVTTSALTGGSTVTKGVVRVTGRYNGHDYYKDFTFHKTFGAPHCWLDLSSVTIVRNPNTGALTSSSITFRAYRRFNGVTTELNRAAAKGHIVIGGATNAPVYSGESIATANILNGLDIASAPAVIKVELYSGILHTAASKWLDGQDITFFESGRNGDNGTSPYLFDLTNDNSKVNCNAAGNVIGSFESTKAQLYLGAQDIRSASNVIVSDADGIDYDFVAETGVVLKIYNF